MTVLPMGDLATTFSQKMHSSRLKGDLHRMTAELASGKQSDLRRATGGNFNVLASLEHQMGALKAYKTAGSEAAFFASSMQNALGTVQDSIDTIAPLLLQAGDSDHAPWLAAAGSDARARFNTVISAFNINVADQSLMAGTATGTAALADAETMLTALKTAVAAETTAAGIESVVETWFDAGGGFDTLPGYLGSNASRAPFRIGFNESVSVDVTAADQRIRDVLKGYAMASLVDEGLPLVARSERAQLLQTAGERLFTANAGFTNLRGEVGAAEAAIDTAMTRNSTENMALELARNDIVAADPYELAVDLEATQLQLEALYAITARLSRLNLTEFLR